MAPFGPDDPLTYRESKAAKLARTIRAVMRNVKYTGEGY